MSKSSDYEKARLECAKKYNSKIRALETRIFELEAINKAQSEDLVNQVRLQRDFVKLCIFLKIDEKQRSAVLKSYALNHDYDALKSLMGSSLTSPDFIPQLGKVAQRCMNSQDLSISDIVKEFL